MEITNARIKNVTVGFDDRDRLSARMTFDGQRGCYDWGFILTNPTDVQRLMKLMNYAGIYEVGDLSNKIIRVVNKACFFRGFGHPIENKFVPTSTEEFKEVSEAEFEELLKNN